MMSFESLARDRRDYIDAARRNGFEEGLRTLLADLYPDNAHFIYELLQNAEDAAAREVTFDLRPDGLRVEHDGARLFDLRDIDSITGIGQSTKADDATSIGKFGVGFKAVFAYTQSPVIHSGEHSFAILDLFVPTAVEPDTRPGLTTFWFPFDRREKPAEHAVAEVTKALREISRSTLLFLTNIRTIACYFPDGDERLLERRAVSEHVVAIDSVHEEGEPSYWYRITGDVVIAEKPYPVAAAFALDKKQEPAARQSPTPGTPGKLRDANASEFAVRPVEGQVFIYFPAVKETSGLRFHIHAPFASTVARDSVRDGFGNDELVGGIATLVASTLPAMRDTGLVGDGLLSALPNGDDDLPERYQVIRERVLAAFQTQSVAPKVGGGYTESTKLVRSVSALRAVLVPEDVDVLREISVGIGENGDRAVGWLHERSGRPGAFLASLKAIDFGPSELAEVFERVSGIRDEIEDWGDEADEYVDEIDQINFQSWTDWIAAKEDAWLRSFYVGLGRIAQHGHNPDSRYSTYGDPFSDSLAGVPIVRVQHGAGVRHLEGSEAYLPTSPGLRADGLVPDSLVPFVTSDGEERKNEKSEHKALREFFEQAGVKEWDAAAQVDARLREYARSTPEITADHLADLDTLNRLLDERAVSPFSYRQRPILVGVKRDGSPLWVAPSKVYIDEPFANTGLTALYESPLYDGTPPARLSGEYLSKDLDVGALAEKLGAVTGLKIEAAEIWSNPLFERSWRWSGRENQNMVARDWSLRHFKAIVDAYDERLLTRLWQVVVTASEELAEAVYRANASSKVYRIDSQLLQSLQTIPWILDRDGNLRLPEDTTKDDLAEVLELPANAPLLKRAGFGRTAELEELKQRGDETRAKELGFDSAEEAREAAKAINEDREGFLDWLRERQGPKLPTAASESPERRAHRVIERASDAPERQYEHRFRSVRVQQPGFREASKQYLRELYTNDDDVMTCQICLRPMPFKIHGEYYFEAVQFLRLTERDLEENALALCPTCSAKYRKALGTDYCDLRDDLLTQDVGSSGSVLVAVTLAGTDESIRFVGTHAIDLQVALDVENASPEDDFGDGIQLKDVEPDPTIRPAISLHGPLRVKLQ